jgi:hypothetical protein
VFAQDKNTPTNNPTPLAEKPHGNAKTISGGSRATPGGVTIGGTNTKSPVKKHRRRIRRRIKKL